ncbi:MAG: hypothetical protein MUF43_14560 [Flavobacterium sp.]|nr:hypothetical protein [Flavobacterium sp.]
MLDKLKQLQQEIYNFSLQDEGEYIIDFSPKLLFFQVGDLFDITFYGEGYDDDPNTKVADTNFDFNFPFCSLLELLSDQKVADKIISLNFIGPDQGANGTKSWEFHRLINSFTTFPNLKNFSVQLTDLADHNQSIIDGYVLEENGIIAKLVSRMPNLEQLIVPSAPDSSFFEIGIHSLRYLKLQAGYDHQNFIENLAISKNFKKLSILDYTDMINFFDIPKEDYTSFESYEKLFKSDAFSSLKHVTLRNTNLNDQQLFELQKLNQVQFLYVKANGGKYVSHGMSDQK